MTFLILVLGKPYIVRPLPKNPDEIREFDLCRFWHDCRYGDSCNFAHSQLELDAWNWIKDETSSQRVTIESTYV